MGSTSGSALPTRQWLLKPEPVGSRRNKTVGAGRGFSATDTSAACCMLLGGRVAKSEQDRVHELGPAMARFFVDFVREFLTSSANEFRLTCNLFADRSAPEGDRGLLAQHGRTAAKLPLQVDR